MLGRRKAIHFSVISIVRLSKKQHSHHPRRGKNERISENNKICCFPFLFQVWNFSSRKLVVFSCYTCCFWLMCCSIYCNTVVVFVSSSWWYTSTVWRWYPPNFSSELRKIKTKLAVINTICKQTSGLKGSSNRDKLPSSSFPFHFMFLVHERIFIFIARVATAYKMYMKQKNGVMK